MDLSDTQDNLAVALLSWMPGDMEKAAAMARDLTVRGVVGKSLPALQAEIHEINVANGWFDDDRSTVEGHMLIVSEVAEATEAYRRWKLEDQTPFQRDEPTKPEGVGSEYADILIRLLDQCERDDIDLDFEVERKLAFNRTRGYRHGNRHL